MRIKIKRIDKSLPLPQYQTPGSVGFDISSRINAVINPGEITILPANLIVEVPIGHALILSARSSLAKNGLKLANGVGIIDQDYHGPKDEIGILVHNFTHAPVEIKKGDRLAQALIMPVEQVEWEEIKEIKTESRGGFGSTGKS